jgi:hypothetical protein
MMTLGVRNAKMTQRNLAFSSRIDQERINSSYSEQKDGLGDDEIENFLPSRSVRKHLIL